jgi:hypothetical protein
VVVAVECLFTWYWLADLCCREGMAFGLGPALDCLHATPAGQQQLARLEKQHGKGKALTMLAARVARAVSYLRKRRRPSRCPSVSLDHGGERGSLRSHGTTKGSAWDERSAIPHARRHGTRLSASVS